MDNPLFGLVVFLCILFLYVHVTSLWKCSNDMEVYEADFESANQLQEICQVKQPVLFHIDGREAGVFLDKFRAAAMEKYDHYDVAVKERADYFRNAERFATVDPTTADLAVDSLALSFRSARRLLAMDKRAQFFTEGNTGFLEESGLLPLAQSMDVYLKPPLSAYAKYDLMMGSPGANTPLRYRLETHQYFVVTSGKIRVKLCPPKYSKTLPLVKDYEHYEFWSPVPPPFDPVATENAPASNHPFAQVLHKTKFLDVAVARGQVLFVPAYWWYSVQFSGNADTTVAHFVYDTVVNIAAQANHWALYYLQQNNIKVRPAKTLVPSVESEGEAADAAAAAEPPPSPAPPLEERLLTNPIVDPAEPATRVHTSSGEKRTEIVTNAGIYVNV